MIKGLTYAMLITPDVPRARRFFVEQLGLRTEDDEGDIFSQFTTRAGSTVGGRGSPRRGIARTGSPSTSRWRTSTRRTAPGRSAGWRR